MSSMSQADAVTSDDRLTPWLDHLSSLLHLAVFAIAGVCEDREK